MKTANLATANHLHRCLLASAVAGFVMAALAPTPACAQNVALFVNGDPITSYDIEQRMKFIQLATHKAGAREEVVNDLIDEKLKLQVAKKYGLDITDKDVDVAFGDMAKRMKMNSDQLGQALANGGSSAGTLKARIRADFAWQQIVRGKFQSSLQIREKDVLQALETNKKSDASGAPVAYEYTLRPILFVVPRGSPAATVEDRTREAEALRARFQNCDEGLPFARAIRDVAVREEIHKNSGDLAQALRDILDKTPVGKLTAPEVTQSGVEIFALCSRKEASAENAPGRREMRDQMFAKEFQTKAKHYLQELRRAAMIEKVE
jgi:peptidyl-prolyl cis-trans isomerase SurA